MPPTKKITGGEAIASNLHACQIISGRDTERVAKQIDAAALKIAQLAMTDWLLELDGQLVTSATAFQEFSGDILLNDPEAAGKVLAQAEQAVLTARRMIAVGLKAGA